MSIYQLPKDYENIVQEVMSRPISKIVALLPEINKILMSNALDSLINFVKNHSASLGDDKFVIRLLDYQNTSGEGEQISVETIVSALSDGDNVITMTCNGYINELPCFSELDNASLSSFSEEKVIALVDCGQFIEIYANGCCIKELDVLHPKSGPRQTTKFSRLAKDFPLIIHDHYMKHVKYAQSTSHWHDREKRILRCTPQQTEFIFHKDLWNWFEDHKTDFIVFGEVRKLSPDRTDIELVTTKGGKRYIIEIKWLGKNSNKTEFTESKIKDGIKQINQYLERERHTLIAALVVYNGRSEDNYKKLNSVSTDFSDDWCELSQWGDEQVPARGKCLIYFLDSKTASTA